MVIEMATKKERKRIKHEDCVVDYICSVVVVVIVLFAQRHLRGSPFLKRIGSSTLLKSEI